MNNQNEQSSTAPRWASSNSREIIYRIVAKGILTLKTPAHFGNGDKIINIKEGEQANILELYKDPHNDMPLLPGASIAGGLRHYLTQRKYGYRQSDDDKKSDIYRLFGDALNETDKAANQSRLIIHDAYSDYGRVIIRDGVKIDGKTRTAQDKELYQIEMWDVGTQFPLRLELILYKEDEAQKSAYLSAFATLLNALQDGEIPMGARKNRGYGQCAVDAWAVYEYGFANIDHFLLWVNGVLPDATPQFVDNHANYMDARRRVTLCATFALCDSLMIRQYPPESKEPDDKKEPIRHLTNLAGEHLLTGTSIAGALRARAVKIANTIGGCTSLTPDIVDAIFGAHGTSDEDKSVKPKSHASRLIVEETTIQDGDMSLIQTRVKIDRFTGGAYHSALINEQPVFAKPATIITINLELRAPEDAHIGLLLLLLKDLWTEDLPLGGESSIGRGRLQGVSASMTITGKSDSIQFNQHGLLNANQKDDLQGYINKLWGKS